MPRLPGQQPQAPYYTHHQQRQQHHPQQQYPSFQPSPITTSSYQSSTHYNSPVSPLSTSSNLSPTTPKNYISRQIRPLYVPAVLRPTEFPSKAPPPRPAPEDDETSEDSPRPSSSFMGFGGLSAFGRLSRRSTGDSAKSVNGNWNLDMFPKPTGPPTRKHWKVGVWRARASATFLSLRRIRSSNNTPLPQPDHESSVCDHPTCKKYFSYFTRRHHCRKCGNIFCDAHSAFQIPLDQDANYNPRAAPSRACGHCYAQFKEWRSRINNQSLNPDSSRDDGNGNIGAANGNGVANMPTTPVPTSPTAPGFGAPLHNSDASHSVPRDWNWSTF